MNSKNISSLAEMLVGIGFDSSIGQRLVQHICFKPSSFILTERLSRGNDLLTCTIFLERKADNYMCHYYDVSLFRETALPDLTIQSVSVRELDKRMAGIAWDVSGQDEFNFVNEDTWQREFDIETIVTDLSRLAVAEEGRHLADYLKVKYWSGVSLPAPGENLNALRAKFEVSQRFYFFDGKGISVDEAYRFLLNRWLEKKMNAKKKRSGDGDRDADETSEANSGAGDKPLLQKKRKRRTQKIK